MTTSASTSKPNVDCLDLEHLDGVGGEGAGRDVVAQERVRDGVLLGRHHALRETHAGAGLGQVGVGAADRSQVRRLEPLVHEEATGLRLGVLVGTRQVQVRGQQPLRRAGPIAVEV